MHVITKLQIETARWYHTPIRMAKIQNHLTMATAGKDAKGKPSFVDSRV